jgi:protein O-mannosyl-transferase
MSSVRVEKKKFLPVRLTLNMCLAILLYATTFIAYWPSLHGGLVWDDIAHITRPELQSLRGLGRIWFEVGATQQYYPLLHSAFWVEHRLWGDNTFGYHVLNAALHATAACLFALILSELSINGAWIGAFIFALHPVSVESVAWISEQKNTLSAVFYLSAMLLYLRHDEQTQGGGSRFTSAYFISLACFTAAILSKSATATLPAALLVILWWKRGRLSWNRDVLPLVPWFAIGIGSGLVTAWVERRFLGAVGNSFSFSAVQRSLIAGRAVSFYLSKLLWPYDLMFIYPRWDVDGSIWWQYLFPAGVIMLVAGAWRIRSKSRAPLAAALFFVGSLFPALGFVNVYPFIFSFVADHFQYIASLGVIALAAAFCRGKRRTAFAIVTVGILGTLTWLDCLKYRDAETLYRTTILQNRNCWMCYNNLGVTFLQEGRLPEAMQQFQEAIRVKPDSADALGNLGNVLITLGQPQEAMPYLQKAFQSTSDYGDAKLRFGAGLLEMNRVTEAISDIREGTRLKPNRAAAHSLLGAALRRSGQLAAAKAEFQEAIRLEPESAPLYRELAETQEELGETDEAILQFETAVRIDPQYADAHQALAELYAAKGRPVDAAAHYQEVLRLKPDQPVVHNDLAVVLMGLKKPQEAEAHLLEAIRLKPDYADAHYNFGLMLLAGRSRRAEAITELKSSLRYAPNHAEAHWALGAVLYDSRQFAEAVAEFAEAKRLKPDLAGVQDDLELARRAASKGLN